MKKHLLALSAAAVLLAPQTVGAEGFAINEWSAEGMAMGGARMFAENDAANMAYNPASLTKIKGEVFKASVSYLSPHGKWKAEPMMASGTEMHGRNRVHPGIVPGMYYVRQLNDKEWVGLGAYTRFGMICQFERDSIVGSNAFSSRLNGMSVGANYARKLDDKWSASVGAEVNYVGLQLDKNLFGTAPLHVEGTSYALGWNLATNYAFDDKNEIGVVYRSKVKHSMEADYDAHGSFPNPAGGYLPASGSGDVYGVVTLPENLMIGYNHKFNDKTRVELNGTWTRWSRFDALQMNFGGTSALAPTLSANPGTKDWKDGWRYAIGIEHKLSDKYTLLGGIAYDEGSIPFDHADFMVPTGRRVTYTIGTQYHDKKQTVALGLGWMDVGRLKMTGNGKNDLYKKAEMYDSYTKMIAVSYQYHF